MGVEIENQNSSNEGKNSSSVPTESPRPALVGDLLPCPWCGDPVETKEWPEREEVWRYEIACLSDECCVLPSINARTREAAVSAWNTRPSAGRGWRDIESAPRDGTAILVARTRQESHIVRWMISAAKGAADGWWFVGGYDGPRLAWRHTPTHWMPLPAAPEANDTERETETTTVR